MSVGDIFYPPDPTIGKQHCGDRYYPSHTYSIIGEVLNAEKLSERAEALGAKGYTCVHDTLTRSVIRSLYDNRTGEEADPDQPLPHNQITWTGWLTETVINEFLALVIDAGWTNTTRLVTTPKLMQFYVFGGDTPEGRYRSVGFGKMRYLTGDSADKAQYRTILFPCNFRAGHWTLAVAIPHRRCIIYINSLGGDGVKACETVRDWMAYRWLYEQRNFQRRLTKPIDDAEQRSMDEIRAWEVVVPQKKPRQEDCHNCGVFVCSSALSVILNGRLVQPECHTLRMAMLYSLMEGIEGLKRCFRVKETNTPFSADGNIPLLED